MIQKDENLKLELNEINVKMAEMKEKVGDYEKILKELTDQRKMKQLEKLKVPFFKHSHVSSPFSYPPPPLIGGGRRGVVRKGERRFRVMEEKSLSHVESKN